MEHDPAAPKITLSGGTNAEFLDFRGPERASLIVRNGRGMAYLRRGMTFERPRAHRVTETARILTILLDEQRVPHVRFEVTTHRAGHKEVSSEELRTLSLNAFVGTYCSDEGTARFACEAPRRSGAFGRALQGGLRRLLPARARSAAFIASYPEAPGKSAAGDHAGALPHSA